MKTHFLLVAVGLFFLTSCRMEEAQNKEVADAVETTQPTDITACGVADPAKNLPWLAELIAKAEKDKVAPPYTQGDDYKPGHYIGKIWLEKHKGRDIFVTNMMLGSGGIAYWFFDCDGNHLASRAAENCIACQYVGNHHFFIDEDDFDDFQSFVLNMKLEAVIYSTF